MRTVAFCEIDPYCQAVLKKRWPGVPVYPDVCNLNSSMVDHVDVICGGFPCQDISQAGTKAGIEGKNSGLWREFARLIGEVRPRYVIVENVAALLIRGLDRVLGDLASLGYDAEWHCIPASAVGAPHRRDRIWIVAYPNTGGQHQHIPVGESFGSGLEAETKRSSKDVANAERPCIRAEVQCEEVVGQDSNRPASWLGRSSWWDVEPSVGRVANGVPARSHRLKALGNAVVPQIPEIIGKAIIEYERHAKNR